MSNSPSNALICEVDYNPPFDWESLLSFLSGRASNGVESIEGNRYIRTVALDNHQGWITVENSENKNTLIVSVSNSLVPSLLPTLTRVKRLFDLSAKPQQIALHLGSIAKNYPGLRVPGAFDGFEIAIRAILGQQISVKAATTLSGRFSARFGKPIETPFKMLTRLTPTAECVASAKLEDLIELGIISSRAKAILALAEVVAKGDIVLEPVAEITNIIAQLKELPGIGEWTAQYIAMRVLGWPDAFPHTDLGIYKALGEKNPKRVLKIAEAWQPWRSYAAMHLWKSLEKSLGTFIPSQNLNDSIKTT